ncbi:hypothetical protein V8C42DRAFT_343699 [Trichoderma barbatum]
MHFDEGFQYGSFESHDSFFEQDFARRPQAALQIRRCKNRPSTVYAHLPGERDFRVPVYTAVGTPSRRSPIRLYHGPAEDGFQVGETSCPLSPTIDLVVNGQFYRLTRCGINPSSFTLTGSHMGSYEWQKSYFEWEPMQLVDRRGRPLAKITVDEWDSSIETLEIYGPCEGYLQDVIILSYITIMKANEQNNEGQAHGAVLATS